MRTAQPAQLSRRDGSRAAVSRSTVRRTALAIGAVLALSALLWGCARHSPEFPFSAGEARVALYELPAEAGHLPTLSFTLAHPVPIDRASEGLFLSYTDAEPGLTLQAVLSRPASDGAASGADAPRAVEAELPIVRTLPPLAAADAPAAPDATAGPNATSPPDATASAAASPGRATELELPLPEGVELTGFRIVGMRSGGAAAGRPRLTIHAAGVATVSPGVEIGASRISLLPGYGFAAHLEAASAAPGGSTVVESLTFAPITRRLRDAEGARQVQVVLRYRFDAPPAAPSTGRAAPAGHTADAAASAGAPSFPGDVLISAVRGEEERAYRLTPNPGEHTVYLYTASCRFSPESLRIESSDPAFHLVSLDVLPFTPARLPATRPIPADLGTILTYDQRSWRNPEYELFSWSMVPDVLVFDFRDYHTQGEYLARFAYFIEKKGLRGTILSIPAVRGLDGWNAHDYRPQDLALFYNTARERGYPLRPGEETLKRILLANGLLTEADGTLKPGMGALISVAQSSWFGLRYLLLTHEAFHGIYFTHPAYREAVHQIWDHLDPSERLFWRLLFGSQDYDPSDRYLMVNEFQAYLMQQPLVGVDPRYRGWAVGHVERAFPADAPAIRRMMADHPQIFLDTAKELDAAVYRIAGVHAGQLVTLVPQSHQ